MRRRSIFGAIAGVFGAGIARAQCDYSAVVVNATGASLFCKDGTEKIIYGHVGGPIPPLAQPKPLNGHCPVCGTIAEPYKPQIDASRIGECRACAGETACLSACFIVTREMLEKELPTERRIDCDYCGCTFRQFAEVRRIAP